MNDELRFQDTIYAALNNLKGVSQALMLVTDDATNYYMCQLFSEDISDEIDKILEACPEEWDMPKSLI